MTRHCILKSIGLATLLFAGSVRVATTAPAETHALVEMSEHCLIGGVQNQRWVSADRFQKRLKSSGRFELYTLKGAVGEIELKRNAESECHESWTEKTCVSRGKRNRNSVPFVECDATPASSNRPHRCNLHGGG